MALCTIGEVALLCDIQSCHVARVAETLWTFKTTANGWRAISSRFNVPISTGIREIKRWIDNGVSQQRVKVLLSSDSSGNNLTAGANSRILLHIAAKQ